ncbi:BTAD domain-containing putative transcriptional regulator [Paenibacillus rubinfantis]|uniref:BTAD domain-containing putative transcriptional regulator n=1 Tax=Paenibacillus rubinfantis TaxID=1720296 RepID=UPI00073EAE06|nr:BTAD domain-containing putative transcriptional regulator [Paenibacillus rubinfantis]
MVELLYFHMMITMRRWNEVPSKVEQARIRYEAMREHMDELHWRTLMGNIYILCATSAFIERDLPRVKHFFILADQYIPIDSFSHQMGRNRHYGVEEFDDHLGYLDDYHGALELFIELLAHWKDQQDHPFGESMHASYSKLLYEWNRLDEAQAWIRPLLNPNRHSSNPRSLYHLYVSAARIQQAQGFPERAIALLDELKLRIHSPDYSVFLRKIESEQASLSVRGGNLEYGTQWLERCGMTAADDVSLDNVFEQVNLVRVLAACSRTREASLLAERLYPLLEREGRLRDRIQILIVQSVSFYRSGQEELALMRLDAALHLAEPQSFNRSFLDEGAIMEELLSAYQKTFLNSDTPRVSEYVKELLCALRNKHAPSAAPVLAHINDYGGFRIRPLVESVGEVKWRTAKTEELMALLAHHRGEPVDKNEILDNLWPEADMEQGFKLLHTTVHYLRKNLQEAGFGNIVSFARGSYRLDMTHLSTDHDTFRRQLSEELPQGGEALKDYEAQLHRVYRAGYLAGKDYVWAESDRNLMMEEYIRLLLQIQERYVQEHRLTEAAESLRMAISIDPLNEEVHEKLIHVYLLSDNRIAARQQYELLRDMLHSEFDAEPREEITRRILSV